MSHPDKYATAYQIAGEKPTANGHRRNPRRHLTDLGNAERFVDEFGETVRYCGPWSKWFYYDNTRWVPDDTGEIVRRMKRTVRGIYAEATEAEGEEVRKAIAAHASRSEARARMEDAIRLARSEPGIPMLPANFDNDPWLLNCRNGTVDLRTGKLRDHRSEDLITKIAPVAYDSEAEAPTFAAFLKHILPPEAIRKFVQKVIGYAATGAVWEEILVILVGRGANGKSTLLNIIMAALGDYAMQAAPDLLMAKRASHPTELADLFGARFVSSVEVDEDRHLAEALVKQLTGRDPIKARRMREDFWQFDPTHTLFLATNHRPEIRGTDHAVWRRIRSVPFDVTIPEDDQDKRLSEKLHAELPGIAAWIVRGCLLWRREGLGTPKEIKAATDGYRDDMDVLGKFIEDRCVAHEGVQAGASQLYGAYLEWCKDSSEEALTQTKFGLSLQERGFARKKSGTYSYYGIGLRSDQP